MANTQPAPSEAPAATLQPPWDSAPVVLILCSEVPVPCNACLVVPKESSIAHMSTRSLIIAMSATTIGAADLVISVGTQNGFFQSDPENPTQSGDIGPMK